MSSKTIVVFGLFLISLVWATSQVKEDLHRKPCHRSCSHRSSSSSSSSACCGCRGDPIKMVKRNTEQFQYYMAQNMPSLAANFLAPNYSDMIIFHNNGPDCCEEHNIFFELNASASGQFTRNMDYHYNVARNNTVVAKGTTFMVIDNITKVFNFTYLWSRQQDCSFKLYQIYGVDFDCINRELTECAP